MRFAILASLVFHLLLLWPELPRTLNPEALLLQATLRQSSPAAPASAAPAPSPTPQTPARPAGDLSGTRAEPAPGAADSAAGSAPAPRMPVLASRESDLPQPVAVLPAPAKSAASVPPPAPRPAARASTVVMPATVAPVAGSTSGTLLTQANATGEALDGLRGYRLSVATQARRFKRYPREAMAEGWAGSTEVRLEVGSDGRPRAATVVRPSGHEALDRAALAMIDSGAQRAQLPESLRGKSFAVLLPVVFNLEDE